jgi:hypothetical protein
MEDGAQQLADERQHEQAPVDVLEPHDSGTDGIHRAIAHTHSMTDDGACVASRNEQTTQGTFLDYTLSMTSRPCRRR